MKIQHPIWVIMDKKRKLIAKGVPRNRYLCLVDDTKDKKRILTYSSQKMAEAAFSQDLGFYSGMGVYEYLKQEYGTDRMRDIMLYLEAVPATLTIEL